jgi:hypothetical protein
MLNCAKSVRQNPRDWEVSLHILKIIRAFSKLGGKFGKNEMFLGKT